MIEKQLEWHWIGRIRGMDFIAWKSQAEHWFKPKLLSSKATPTAQKLGLVNWLRNWPLSAFIVLVRQPKKQRPSAPRARSLDFGRIFIFAKTLSQTNCRVV